MKANDYIMSQVKANYLKKNELNELYFLLNTLDAEELEALKEELASCRYDTYSPFPNIVFTLRGDINYLINAIDRKLNPPPAIKRNKSIESLIKLFKEKKSKKVVSSRNELKERYDYQSFTVQRKILAAFLDGVKGDREWAYRILFRNWDAHFADKIKDLWEKHYEEHCRWLVVKYLGEDYLLHHEEAWRPAYDASDDEVSNAYKFVCLRLAGCEGFEIDWRRLNRGDSYEVKSNIGIHVSGAEMLSFLFEKIADYVNNMGSRELCEVEFDNVFQSGECNCSATAVCELQLILYCMGRFKMSDELIYYFAWDKRVCALFGDRLAESGLGNTRCMVYKEVLKELLPSRGEIFALFGEVRYTEEQTVALAGVGSFLPVYETDISSERRCEEIERLCRENPAFAAMVDKLNLV